MTTTKKPSDREIAWATSIHRAEYTRTRSFQPSQEEYEEAGRIFKALDAYLKWQDAQDEVLTDSRISWAFDIQMNDYKGLHVPAEQRRQAAAIMAAFNACLNKASI